MQHASCAVCLRSLSAMHDAMFGASRSGHKTLCINPPHSCLFYILSSCLIILYHLPLLPLHPLAMRYVAALCAPSRRVACRSRCERGPVAKVMRTDRPQRCCCCCGGGGSGGAGGFSAAAGAPLRPAPKSATGAAAAAAASISSAEALPSPSLSPSASSSAASSPPSPLAPPLPRRRPRRQPPRPLG